jgi:Icc protein
MMSAASTPLVVLQLTDTHFLAEAHQDMLGINTEKYFLNVLEHAFANDQHYDVMVLSGDLAQAPCIESYQRLRDHLLALPLPVLCLPGNHDDFNLMQALLNTGNLSCAKQHVFKHWQIICLNSQIPEEQGGHLASSELALLKQALEEYPEHHALIAVHHHCLPTHSAWLDTMIIQNSDALLELLRDYPQAKMIVTGHIHQVLTQHHHHLQIFGTPSTCFQFTPNSPLFSVDKTAPGYRTLSLYPDGTFTTGISRLAQELHELKLDGKGYFDHP